VHSSYLGDLPPPFPNLQHPRPQDVNFAKTSYLELTTTERNVYDQTFKHYQVFLKEHEHQMKGLQDAKNLIKTRPMQRAFF
jgi:hypothetical protein